MHILSLVTYTKHFLNQRKKENDGRKYFMINHHESMGPGSNSRPLDLQLDSLLIALWGPVNDVNTRGESCIHFLTKIVKTRNKTCIYFLMHIVDTRDKSCIYFLMKSVNIEEKNFVFYKFMKV